MMWYVFYILSSFAMSDCLCQYYDVILTKNHIPTRKETPAVTVLSPSTMPVDPHQEARLPRRNPDQFYNRPKPQPTRVRIEVSYFNSNAEFSRWSINNILLLSEKKRDWKFFWFFFLIIKMKILMCFSSDTCMKVQEELLHYPWCWLVVGCGVKRYVKSFT